MEEEPTELPVGVAEGINDDGRAGPETCGGLTEVMATVVPVDDAAVSVVTAELTLSSAVFVELAASDVVVALTDVVVEDASTGVASNPHAVAALETEPP